MSFKTEIEAIVGDIDSPDYTAEAVLYLTQGVKFITTHVMDNPQMENRLTSSATLNNSSPTLSLLNILRIVSITRTDGTVVRECIEIEPYKAGLYGDTNSIYYTSKFDPKYYIENNTLNILPIPTASQTAIVRKIQPDTSVALSDTSVDNFPDELERGVVLYASKEMLRKFLSSKNDGLPANMSIPSTPSTATVGTVTVGALSTAPAYTKTSLTLTSAPSISALSVTASAPASITLSTVAYTDASAGDASSTAVSAVTIGAVADANVTTSNSNISALPAYSKPSISMTAAPSISALNIGASAPASITLGTVAYVDASVSDAATTGEAVGAITIPAIADANVTTNVPDYTKPATSVDFAAGSTGVDDWITDEDPEMAQVALEKQAQLLSDYQLDITNELNEFNKDNVRYQAEISEELTKHNTALEKAIAQAQIDAADAQQESKLASTRNLQNQQKDLQIKLEAAAKDMESIIAQNNAKVADYNARIQLYGTQVNDEVQQYQLNLERELGLWNTKRNTELSQYQADIQNELNEFQRESSNYQVEVQEELTKQNVLLERVVTDAQIAAQKAQQDAAATTDVAKFNKQKDLQISMEARTNDMQALIANNNAKVADYNARIDLYSAQVNDQVQEYAQNLERQLQLLNIQRNTELQKHQNDIQDELNEFNKELSIYQTDLQQKIKQAEISSEKEAYEIQNYATEVESYGQQINKEVQNFNTKLQKINTDYQWYSDQYNKVSQDLLEFLVPYIKDTIIRGESDEVATNDRSR